MDHTKFYMDITIVDRHIPVYPNRKPMMRCNVCSKWNMTFRSGDR